MGRIYEASFETSSISAAKTLMIFEVPSDRMAELHEAEVVAPDNDLNEQLHFTFQEIGALGSPTATSVIPVQMDGGDPASAVTVSADVTASEPGYLSDTEIGQAGAPSLAGYQYRPATDGRPVWSPSSVWGLRLLTAPGDAKVLTVRVKFKELGGGSGISP